MKVKLLKATKERVENHIIENNNKEGSVDFLFKLLVANGFGEEGAYEEAENQVMEITKELKLKAVSIVIVQAMNRKVG